MDRESLAERSCEYCGIEIKKEAPYMALTNNGGVYCGIYYHYYQCPQPQMQPQTQLKPKPILIIAEEPKSLGSRLFSIFTRG